MQMEKEIKELTKQRDLAQSRLEDLLRVVGNGQKSRKEVYLLPNQSVTICLMILLPLVIAKYCSINSEWDQSSS